MIGSRIWWRKRQWETLKHKPNQNLLNPFRPLTIGGGVDKLDVALNNEQVNNKEQQQQFFQRCGRAWTCLIPSKSQDRNPWRKSKPKKNSRPFLVWVPIDLTNFGIKLKELSFLRNCWTIIKLILSFHY